MIAKNIKQVWNLIPTDDDDELKKDAKFIDDMGALLLNYEDNKLKLMY